MPETKLARLKRISSTLPWPKATEWSKSTFEVEESEGWITLERRWEERDTFSGMFTRGTEFLFKLPLDVAIKTVVFLHGWLDSGGKHTKARDFTCGDCKGHNDSYMVKYDVWHEAKADRNTLLCLPCLEARLGRRVTLDDLLDAPINQGFRYFGNLS